MHPYLVDTKFASESLTGLIAEDYEKLQILEKTLLYKIAEAEEKYNVFLQYEFHPAENLYHAMAMKAHEEKQYIDKEISEIRNSIDAKRVSIDSLSGALLQIAKQGISTAHGKPDNAPNGFMLGTTPIKKIVWEGRNQTIHYENPKEVSAIVCDLFKELDKHRNDGVSWVPKHKVNYAYEVLNILGWQDYSKYEEDMKSILK